MGMKTLIGGSLLTAVLTMCGGGGGDVRTHESVYPNIYNGQCYTYPSNVEVPQLTQLCIAATRSPDGLDRITVINGTTLDWSTARAVF